ncbi:MAG: hypothetical protein JST75_12520 [Bacteroidetes bacterium]|nr:hypothetical protein [Bacteroidota bacterium]
MRYKIFFPLLLLILNIFFQSCSKSSPTNNNSGNGGNDTIISPPSKYVVDTYAGDGIQGTISDPQQLCIDSKGVLYVSETGHNCIKKIDPVLQTIGLFAGLYDNPGCADDPFGSGTPSLTFPGNLFINKDDQIFIGDYGCAKLKVANTTGMLSTLDYNNPNNLFPDVSAITQDPVGNIFLAGTYDGVYEIRASDQVLVSVINGTETGIISSMAMGPGAENVYVSAKHSIIRIYSGQATTIAGDSLGDRDGVGAAASFGGAMSICTGSDGTIYVADTYNNKIRAVSPNGQVTTIAGDGHSGFVNGPGDKAEFAGPSGIAFTTSGGNNILYVSDNGNSLIRKITFPNK